MFVVAISFFNKVTVSATLLKCVSMNYQECKIRPEIAMLIVMSLHFIFLVLSKCSGSGNNINDPYAKMCVPDVVKDINVRVFNLMSRTNAD